MSQEITHEQHAELDLSGLAPGAYFVTVQSAGRQRTKKLMKL
ncbi:T9SS type A sorting domain-containing protein [Salmonella enterica]